MLPNYALSPFMVSIQHRTVDEIFDNLCDYEEHGFGSEYDYTKTKDGTFFNECSIFARDEKDYLAFSPEKLIPRLSPHPICSRFLCIDFDFLTQGTNYLKMKYGVAFNELASGIEQHFKTFFDKKMKLSEGSVYFAMSLAPKNELSYITRSVVIPTSTETLEVFPNMLSYSNYKFVNFCDAAEDVLHQNLQKIMKNMIFSAELGDYIYMDLTREEMLPDVDDRTLYPMSRYV
ncbi:MULTISPECIES: hypothetical protein [Gluconobacter]|nr:MULTISPECIES: hypothetical protein [Gluconobacter]MBS1029564.1 hypothetical protein [Gluconobacter albidus]MBS1053725.1 hypothetical protein [Gluconobacter kondonii]MBS1058113.1 hypothetical protein [Gluconobacter kondonii]MCP1274495.1 hypothetical protein [Gluconobacter albidus]